MIEEWRPCFGGYYSVSNLGRVRREKTGPGTHVGRILRAAVTSRGYLCVDLYDSVSHRVIGVHQLVAEAFLSPCEGRPQVNHRNGIKADNCLGNLEYVSCSENHLHAFRTGLRANRNRKLTVDAVRDIRARLSSGARQTHLAAEYGVTQATIWGIGARKSWRDIT